MVKPEIGSKLTLTGCMESHFYLVTGKNGITSWSLISMMHTSINNIGDDHSFLGSVDEKSSKIFLCMMYHL
jgi:hypothetical protein